MKRTNDQKQTQSTNQNMPKKDKRKRRQAKQAMSYANLDKSSTLACESGQTFQTSEDSQAQHGAYGVGRYESFAVGQGDDAVDDEGEQVRLALAVVPQIE